MFLQQVKKIGYQSIRVSDGQDTDLDTLAAASKPERRFLTSAWFRAGSPDCETVAARREDGEPIAALPFTTRRLGPLRIGEVAGGYWPFRSFPLAADLDRAELASFLADPQAKNRLGRLWRFGPVYEDDPTMGRIVKAAREAGWTMIKRPVGTAFELDMAALRADGQWPRTKTLRKNRWRERRLEADGEVRYEFLTGANWTAAHRDAMAEIEANCWLAKLGDSADTKFLDKEVRAMWEAMARDPVLAPMLFTSLMWIGERPAAFAFGIEAGAIRYYIANNYDERFSRFGPGKLLLYKDFERAADNGIERISWGAGDAGYKTEMGATPGPEIFDIFFVRGRWLAGLIRPLLMRNASET